MGRYMEVNATKGDVIYLVETFVYGESWGALFVYSSYEGARRAGRRRINAICKAFQFEKKDGYVAACITKKKVR